MVGFLSWCTHISNHHNVCFLNILQYCQLYLNKAGKTKSVFINVAAELRVQNSYFSEGYQGKRESEIIRSPQWKG